MKRDFELIFLIFNVLIENENNHVTTREDLHTNLDSYNHACIEYHLQLMTEQGWIKIFTDGIRMTWEGHDHYDAEYFNEGVEKDTEQDVSLKKV